MRALLSSRCSNHVLFHHTPPTSQPDPTNWMQSTKFKKKIMISTRTHTILSAASSSSTWSSFSPVGVYLSSSAIVVANRTHRVKLLINRQSGEAVAMKMVDLKKHPDAESSVKKEVCIQKILQHPNILKFFGKRTQGDIEYIFLEYASGGELFDRIGKSSIIFR